MDKHRLSAVFFVTMMLLSGCLGGVEQEEIPEEVLPSTYELKVSWTLSPDSITMGEDAVFLLSVDQVGDGEFEIVPNVLLPSFTSLSELDWEKQDDGYKLSFLTEYVGDYIVQISFTNTGFNSMEPQLEPLVHLLEVTEPVESAPIITAPVQITLEQPNIIWFEGSVTHDDPTTCKLVYETSDGTKGSLGLSAEFTWKTLMDFTNSEESVSITTVATCGRYTVLSDTFVTQVVIEGAGEDEDGDGIPTINDNCPQGLGKADGWVSNEATDGDRDGCRDSVEDDDDDNDGIIDAHDLCPKSYGWVSTPSADYDYDGCHDADEDLDDDGDGVDDVDDLCPIGRKGWSSNDYSDWDEDGCSDLDEDDNDDNDDFDDDVDQCPKGWIGWQANNTSDWDRDGCKDSTEDEDDDNDGVNDVNSTGAALDLCPETPLNSTSVNEHGCAAVQRDTDQDGINDELDQCEGTPAGLVVNSLGCADLDGDGVFANVDICAESPDRWTIDNVGCAVVQRPVNWTSSSSLNGPMQTVPNFSFPTLSGTYNFQNEWTGYDVYMFMFKYTDSSGNSNYATWGQNPGKFIRNLPDNTQLFYGSFDNSYHNDVVQQRNAVLAGLTTQEEQKWEQRIHYIDIDASNLAGGIGSMISSFNNPFFMGIDRFQLARETGSLYAWTTSSNDPFHLSHEPNQWVAEFPTKIREQDPSVHAIDILDFQRHSGGWQGGFSSFSNAVFDLPNDLSSYDTLEVYHEHACFERKNRYQNSDQSYGGCHEWDYLANLYICDADNSSICNTEIMRWITTYGREGQWLTDISPYLFMLNDGEDRRFKYGGANKGDLTVTFLFSNWNSGERAINATYAFSGGQFDGTYNNESRYVRQLNFTTPSWATKVEIVATITGHGFGKDNANCAEFCDHQHYYTMGSNQVYEWHPIVYDNEGCENEVRNGVVANQYGSWPYGRAGWCAGQDVKQWTYDITDWVDNSTNNNNHLTYRGYYNGQEYVPSDGVGNGERNIRAVIYVVYYGPTTAS